MLPNANAAQAEDLMFESYGAGYAWLRSELDTRDAQQLDQDLGRVLDTRGDESERRYTITQAGRDYLAHKRAVEYLFGPWPTVAEVEAQARARTAA